MEAQSNTKTFSVHIIVGDKDEYIRVCFPHTIMENQGKENHDEIGIEEITDDFQCCVCL